MRRWRKMSFEGIHCSRYVIVPRKFATLVRTNRYLGRRKISRAILNFPTMRLELSALRARCFRISILCDVLPMFQDPHPLSLLLSLSLFLFRMRANGFPLTTILSLRELYRIHRKTAYRELQSRRYSTKASSRSIRREIGRYAYFMQQREYIDSFVPWCLRARK